MRHLFIILSLFMFNISGCALVKTSDVEARAKNTDEAFDTPFEADLDSSMIDWYESLDIKLSGELDLDLPENVEATITIDLPEDEGVNEKSTTENTENSDQDETKAPAEENNNTEHEQVTVQVDATEDNEITVTQETNAFTRALAINEIMEAQGLDDNVGVKTKLILIDSDDVVSESWILSGLRLHLF